MLRRRNVGPRLAPLQRVSAEESELRRSEGHRIEVSIVGVDCERAGDGRLPRLQCRHESGRDGSDSRQVIEVDAAKTPSP
jgi:hypothetical protein